jgi:hypothetical protein
MTNIPPFTPIEVNYENLTIMGVPFPDLQTLKNCASGIGSNMYEGFKPTPKGIEILRDKAMGKISQTQMVAMALEELDAKRKQL